ncbi:MAG: hypothetical protein HYX47_08820 [Burkholderiales bacterium]|nr:hypothetical protein [Burkholderiales bacterium]
MESRIRLSQALSAAGFALAACTAQAQRADLMSSPGCVAARQQFEAALAAGTRTAPPQLAVARRRTALACFGSEPDTAQGAPAAPSPPAVAVRPVDPLVGSPTLRAAPMLAAPPPPVAIARPPVITTCDAGGCWDSDGQRHNQMGPLLAGPRGACTLQAGVLVCP